MSLDKVPIHRLWQLHPNFLKVEDAHRMLADRAVTDFGQGYWHYRGKTDFRCLSPLSNCPEYGYRWDDILQEQEEREEMEAREIAKQEAKQERLKEEYEKFCRENLEYLIKFKEPESDEKCRERIQKEKIRNAIIRDELIKFQNRKLQNKKLFTPIENIQEEIQEESIEENQEDEYMKGY